MIFRARTSEATNGADAEAIVSERWGLGDLAERYDEFLGTFRPVFAAARKARTIAPKPAFMMRTLLIHEYRKVHLRDPLLPPSLLPTSWPGGPAYQLSSNLYALVQGPAEDYLGDRLETAEGPLPPPAESLFQRFAGILQRT
jgi:phenylacetic acid degradation operon negative regulatory protein